MAGLDPAIHAPGTKVAGRSDDVDPRVKPGDDELMLSDNVKMQPKTSNRTAVGHARQ
jgi:hypothetical protein